MNKAKETYEDYGYSTTCVTDPSELTFLSNVVGKQIQLHWCHGAYDQLVYNDVGMKIGPTEYKHEVPLKENLTIIIPSYSVDDFDWSDKLLITLASCMLHH